METRENLKRTLESSGGSSLLFTGPNGVKRRLKYSDIKARIMDRFRNEQYDELKQDWLSYNLSPDSVNKFFAENGSSILNWVVIGAPNANPLCFLCENISKEVLANLLEKKDYSILETFLLGQAGREELKLYDQAIQLCQIGKLKLLLTIDPPGVQEFMERNSLEEYMTPSIKDNFSEALKLYRTEYPAGPKL